MTEQHGSIPVMKALVLVSSVLATAVLLVSCGESSEAEPEKVSAKIKHPVRVSEAPPIASTQRIEEDETVASSERRYTREGGKGGFNREEWQNMTEEERAERRRQRIAEIDTNGDGNLGKDEVPERMWEFIGRADTNGDDMVSESERTEFRAQMEAERAVRELTGEGGGDRFGRRGKGGGGFKGGGGKGSD